MLNAEEKNILKKLAEGCTNYEISNSIGCNESELGVLLRFMQAKLGAKTLAHLMSRAWEIGLLGSKALFFCVVVLSASNIFDTKVIRSNRTVRTQVRINKLTEAA